MSATASEISRRGPLHRWIVEKIRTCGPVPFSRFMDWCLYHPRYGYYCSGRTSIGRDGDYFTGPCVHPLFGGMVARQLGQMSELLPETTFTVLEVGAGRGFLCRDILDWAEQKAPSFYERLSYLILERSPRFVGEQKEGLAGHSARGKVRWLSSDAVRAPGFGIQGCVLANEFVDALPVHLVVKRDGILQEIYVDERDGMFLETEGPLSDSRIASQVCASGMALAQGGRAEVNLHALDWLADMGCCLIRGFLMIIDYGSLARELYDGSRPAGTLRCFSRHRVWNTPYEEVGSRDITAHVDFSSLMAEGEALGLRTAGLTSQYRFLIALGLLEEIADLQETLSPLEGLRMRLSMKHLLDPEVGMGDIFKVLIQYRGVDMPRLQGLLDFQDLDRRM